MAVYGSFLMMYFGSIGFSATQVGVITSASTLTVLVTQPFWGWASDRAKDGRTVLSILYLCCSVLIFAYYLSKDFIVVLLVASVFAIFYNPIAPIMDSLTLETLEHEKSRYNYGHMRIGGTIGYATMVLLAGRIFANSYIHMFYLGAIFFVIGLFFVRRAGAVKIRGNRGKMSPGALLRNKKIICYLFISLINAFGMMGFYSFYPLHFMANIGDSGLYGILLFATALSEFPFWFITGRVTERFGRDRMMLIAITVVGARWFVLSFLTNFPLLLLVNLLHGFCFVTIHYCIITYLNNEVPKELRATGQSLNNLVAMVVTRIAGGAVFGVLSDMLGIGTMFQFLAALSFGGAIIFYFWTRALGRRAAQAERAST